MRKLNLLTFFGCSCICILAACHEKHPEIRFETRSYDFGTIPLDTMVAYPFVFKNIGSKPLQIDHVRTTCGCTGFSHTKRPIQPDDTGVIHVHYYPDATGDFRKIAVVYSNAANSPKAILKIRGTVRSAVSSNGKVHDSKTLVVR